MKQCIRCGVEKPLEEFSRGYNTKDGYLKVCKECIKNKKKEMANARKLNAQEDVQIKTISREEYFDAIRREIKLRWAKEKKKHDERFERYKHLVIIQAEKRRSDKYGLTANFNREQWKRCLEYFDYKDAYTGLPMKIISQDHFIPLSKGGKYTVDNIIPCERRINSSKHNKLFNEWYPKQSFYNKEREEKIIRYLEMQDMT